MEQQLTTKSLFNQDNVKQKFKELMGERSAQFITSVLQIASSNEMLSKADPMSIYNSAAVAATLNLPLNNSLGFAYIVPFNSKQKDGSYKIQAQFQIGYKGFIQLAQRTGLFKTISATPVYEGQLIEMNPLTGFKFDFNSKKSDKVIGYASYFSLINGFEKTLYLSKEGVQTHANKYSQTAKKNYGLWKDEFDVMAVKTVLKLLLSKYAPMSVELEKAVVFDQSVVKDFNNFNTDYVDSIEVKENKEEERLRLLIESSTSLEELSSLKKDVEMYPDLFSVYELKASDLSNGN